MHMGVLLLIPFFLIRFGLLSRLNKEAVKRAAYFAPLLDGKRTAYWIYQVSSAGIIVYLLFLKVKLTPSWFFTAGLVVYLSGLVLLGVSMVNFAAPAENGINQNGLYRLSRNPMYVAYFIFFMGCVVMTRSLILLAIVLVFQITAHWIILSEERWCIQKFGQEYLEYMEKVRRYI